MALEARCKNSLSLECKGDVSIALGSLVRCQSQFIWRAVFSISTGLYSPLYENERCSLTLPVPRTESTWVLNEELQLHPDQNNIVSTPCSCPFNPLFIFP